MPKLNLDVTDTISIEDYLYHKRKFNPEINDLLYTRFGSIGVPCIVDTNKPFIASYSIVLIKPNHDVVNFKFLYHILNYDKIKKNALDKVMGSANKNLHLGDIKSLKIPIPPLPEQKRIAEILTTADNRIEKEESYRDKLLQMKKGLMQDLLTGRVRVTV
jgi:type I restriction enzyme S subunit